MAMDADPPPERQRTGDYTPTSLFSPVSSVPSVVPPSPLTPIPTMHRPCGAQVDARHFPVSAPAREHGPPGGDPSGEGHYSEQIAPAAVATSFELKIGIVSLASKRALATRCSLSCSDNSSLARDMYILYGLSHGRAPSPHSCACLMFHHPTSIHPASHAGPSTSASSICLALLRFFPAATLLL